jgi:hypothetical protein
MVSVNCSGRVYNHSSAGFAIIQGKAVAKSATLILKKNGTAKMQRNLLLPGVISRDSGSGRVSL